jgi:hypothetical protein
MQRDQFKDVKNPFSSVGLYDFIYDFYMEDCISELYLKTLQFHPATTDINVARTIVLPEKNDPVYLVKNIPAYLKLLPGSPTKSLRQKTIPQYKGYAIDLSKFTSVDDYLNTQFSSRNRRKLKAKLRKLHSLGTLSFRLYYEEVNWEDHVENFEGFYAMLKGRFDQIKMYNRNLIHWPFFCTNSFERIRDKKAFLLVVKLNGVPIAYSLDYINNGLVFGIFQTYDIGYSDYNLGDILMLNKLEWCMANGMYFYDFSIGSNYFKTKWANYEYLFSHQIWYGKSILANAKVLKLAFSLRLRQRLRDWGILGKFFEFDKAFYNRQSQKLKDFNWLNHLEKPL